MVRVQWGKLSGKSVKLQLLAVLVILYFLSPGKYGKNAAGLRNATNKAGLRLVYVDRYEDRTVYHDFFTQFGKTRIYVRQQPPGHGVSKESLTHLYY